jgi:hypothetical protein
VNRHMAHLAAPQPTRRALTAVCEALVWVLFLIAVWLLMWGLSPAS